MTSLFLALLASAAAPAASPAPAPPSPIRAVGCEFPDTYQFGRVSCAVEFHNVSDKPVRLSGIRPYRPRDTVDHQELVVPARGLAMLNVGIDVENDVGSSRHFFGYVLPGSDSQQFVDARGYVTSLIDDPKPRLDFSVVDSRRDSESLVYRFESSEAEAFKVTKVLAKPDHVDVALIDDGRGVRITVKKGAPWGLHEGTNIKLATNSTLQDQVWVRLRYDVHGEVVPASNPFPMGLMRTNAHNEFLLKLDERNGKDFKTGRLEVQGLRADASVVDCTPRARGCKLVKVVVDNDQPTGQIGGVVHIDLPEYEQRLPVFFWGMLLGPEIEVRDIEDADEIKGTSSVEVPAGRVNLASALKEAVTSRSEVPPPPGTGPLIKWSVANEGLIYGYVVYRGESEKGPFRRVNEKTVPAGGAQELARYQWRDASAVSGTTYWYYVGYLRKDGTRQALTGPQKVTAK